MHNYCLSKLEQAITEQPIATWLTRFNLEDRYYDEFSGANRRQVRLISGPVFDKFRNWRSEIGFLLDNEEINNTVFRRIYGLSFRQSWLLSNIFQTSFIVAANNVEFRHLPFADNAKGDEIRVGIELGALLPNKFELNIRAGRSDQDTDEERLNFVRKQYMIELVRHATRRRDVFIRYRHEFSDFESLVPTGEPRKDSLGRFEAGINYNISGHWLLTSIYKFEDSSSNEPPFNYTKNEIEILFGFSF